MDRPPHSPERPDPALIELYRSYAKHLIIHGELDTQLSLRGEAVRYTQFGREAHTYRQIVGAERLRRSHRPDLTRIEATFESAYVLEGQVTPDCLEVEIDDREGVRKQLTLQDEGVGVYGFVIISAVEQPSRSVIPKNLPDALENERMRRMKVDDDDISLMQDALRIIRQD